MRTAWILLFTGLALISPGAAMAQSAYSLTQGDEAVLQSGAALTHVWRDKSRNDGALDVYGAIDVKASPATLWDIMTDCKRSGEIVPNMTSCQVLETSPDKSWDIREQKFKLGFLLPKAKSRFRTTYRPYQSMTIRRVGGDLKVQNAIWSLATQDNGVTRVSYRATILSKLPVPRGLIKRATRKDTPQIMRNLKRAAEDQSLNSLAISSAPPIRKAATP